MRWTSFITMNVNSRIPQSSVQDGISGPSASLSSSKYPPNRKGIPDHHRSPTPSMALNPYPDNNRAQSVRQGSTRAQPKQRSASQRKKEVLALTPSALRLSANPLIRPCDNRGQNHTTSGKNSDMREGCCSYWSQPYMSTKHMRPIFSKVVTDLIWALRITMAWDDPTPLPCIQQW